MYPFEIGLFKSAPLLAYVADINISTKIKNNSSIQ